MRAVHRPLDPPEGDIQAVFEYIGSEGRVSDVLDQPETELGQETQRRYSITRYSLENEHQIKAATNGVRSE